MRADDERGGVNPQLIGVGVVLVVGVLTMASTWSGRAPSVSPFLLVLLVAPVMLGLGFWYQHHRTTLAREWAAAVGWTYVGSEPDLAHAWVGAPFGVGRSRRTSEVVRGVFQGRPTLSFGYTYTTGSGKNRSSTTWHVVAVGLPAALPSLELTPDGLTAKIAKGFGGQDIQLE